MNGMNGMNGGPPPQQVAVNIGPVAEGIWQFQILNGCTQQAIVLPIETMEAILRKGLAQIEASKSRIVVAPANALPKA